MFFPGSATNGNSDSSSAMWKDEREDLKGPCEPERAARSSTKTDLGSDPASNNLHH